jgi:hypothetical protein
LYCARLLRSGLSTLQPAHLHTSPFRMGNPEVGFRLCANGKNQVPATLCTMLCSTLLGTAITWLVG